MTTRRRLYRPRQSMYLKKRKVVPTNESDDVDAAALLPSDANLSNDESEKLSTVSTNNPYNYEENFAGGSAKLVPANRSEDYFFDDDDQSFTDEFAPQSCSTATPASADKKKTQVVFDTYFRGRIQSEFSAISSTLFSPNAVDLYPGCKSGLTEEGLLKKISTISRTNHLTESATLELFNLVNSTLPQGYEVKKQSFERMRAAKCLVFTYDCCPTFDFVFSCDDQKGSNNLLTCPKCGRNRFTDSAMRTSFKSFSYRSLCSILCQLLCNPLFMACIDYELFKVVETSRSDAKVIYDISHGRNFEKHKEEMHAKFTAEMPRRSSRFSRPCVEVSLLLSCYFDGIQVTKRTFESYWPLMVSILNLPPNLRVMYGVGIFTLCQVAIDKGSAAENRMIDLFIQDLQILYEGRWLHVGGKDYFLQARCICHCYDTRALESTLQIQGAGSYAGCGLCRQLPGWGKGKLNTVSYQGHRPFLPWYHYLRYFGQSKLCCELGYYTDKGVLHSAESVSSIISVDWNACKPHFFTSSSRAADIRRFQHQMNGCLLDETRRNDIADFLRGSHACKVPTWFHSKDEIYSIDHFATFIYYRHMDYRPLLHFKKISNEEYCADATAVSQTQKTANGVKGRWPLLDLPYVNIASDIDYDPFHALFNCAHYILDWLFNKRSISIEVIRYCKECFIFPHLWERTDQQQEEEESNEKKSATKEEQSNEKKSANKEEQSNEKKSANKEEQSFLHPWAVSSLSAEMCRALAGAFSAVRFPCGLKNEHSYRRLHTHTGSLKGLQKINIVKNAMSYITYIVRLYDKNIRMPYLHLYRFMSLLFSKLCAPIFVESQLNNLFNETVEAVEVQSSMFPPSESQLVHHELIHIPNFIRENGPPRGFTTLPAERAMVYIKRDVPTGGHAWDKTASKRIFETQQCISEQFYGDPRSIVDRSARGNNAYWLRSLQKAVGKGFLNQQLQFNDFAFTVFDRRRKTKNAHLDNAFFFSSYEKILFTDFLVQETLRMKLMQRPMRKEMEGNLRECEAELVASSSLYRLFVFFRMKRKLLKFPFKRREVRIQEGKSANPQHVVVDEKRYCEANELYVWINAYEKTFLEMIKEYSIKVIALSSSLNLDNVTIYSILEGEAIMQEDIERLPNWRAWLNGEHVFYNEAIIWGSDAFRSRAQQKRPTNNVGEEPLVSSSLDFGSETKRPTKLYSDGCYANVPSNKMNKLAEINCSTRRDNLNFSVWCKVHHFSNPQCELYSSLYTTSSSLKKYEERRFSIAQINYYGIVSLPDNLQFEPVNNIPYCNVVQRKALCLHENSGSMKVGPPGVVFRYDNLWAVQCDNDSESVFWEANPFVAIYNVYSTRLACIPFAKKYNNADSDHLFVTTNETQAIPGLSRLLFYAIDRERECFHDDETLLKLLHPYFNKQHLMEIKLWHYENSIHLEEEEEDREEDEENDNNDDEDDDEDAAGV